MRLGQQSKDLGQIIFQLGEGGKFPFTGKKLARLRAGFSCQLHQLIKLCLPCASQRAGQKLVELREQPLYSFHLRFGLLKSFNGGETGRGSLFRLPAGMGKFRQKLFALA